MDRCGETRKTTAGAQLSAPATPVVTGLPEVPGPWERVMHCVVGGCMDSFSGYLYFARILFK